MKRKITYFLYDMGQGPGSIVLAIVYYILFGILLKITNMDGTKDLLFNGFLWSVLGLFLFFQLGKTGRKIKAEKERFENWRDILASSTSTNEQKERVAWRMLKSLDINEKSLNEIVTFTTIDSDVNNAALEEIHQIKNPTSYEKRG